MLIKELYDICTMQWRATSLVTASLLTSNSQGSGHPLSTPSVHTRHWQVPAPLLYRRPEVEASLPAYLRRNFCTDLLLRLCQPFLGKFRSPITLSNEGLQVIHRLAQERQRAPVSNMPATSELTCSTGNAVLGWFLRPLGSVGRSEATLLLTCPQSHSIKGLC